MTDPQSPAPVDAIENLTNHQKQADMDGVMVTVSREALEEVLSYVRARPAPAPDVVDAVRFYADPISYVVTQESEPRRAIDLDQGKLAKAALSAAPLFAENAKKSPDEPAPSGDEGGVMCPHCGDDYASLSHDGEPLDGLCLPCSLTSADAIRKGEGA